MNWDLDSFCRKYFQECYDGKHNLCLIIIWIILLFSNYAYLVAIAVSIDPKYVDSAWTCFVEKFFHELSKYKTFDITLFIAAEYFSIILLVFYYLMLFPVRKWGLHILQFQANLLNYRECVASNVEIIEYFNEKMSCSKTFKTLWSFLPEKTRACIYHLKLVMAKKNVLIDIKKFESMRCKIDLFSINVLAKTAVFSEFVNLISNITAYIIMILRIFLLLMFRFYLDLNYPLSIFMMFGMFNLIAQIEIQYFAFGLASQFFALLYHMREVNSIFIVYMKIPFKFRLLQDFIFFYVKTQVVLRNSSEIALGLWAYFLVSMNAYICFRMIFVEKKLVYQFIAFILFFLTAFIFISIALLIMNINKQFYKMCKFMPMVIYRLGILRYLSLKFKALGFYEQQCARKQKSGFKLYPNIPINSFIFLKVI